LYCLVFHEFYVGFIQEELYRQSEEMAALKISELAQADAAVK